MDREFKDVLKDAKKDNIESKIIVAKRFELEGKYKDAFRWYLEAANDENVESQVKLGDYYLNGIGVKQDYSKANYWYKKAADYDSAEAISNLAYLYKEGKGVEKNLDEAFDLYLKAANLGNVDAKYNLGVMYRNSIGVKQDNQKSFYWVSEAAKEGHVNAKVNLGYFYCNGIGTEVNEEQGVALYKEAADLGNSTALFNLGMCYKNGYGAERNIEAAIVCYEEAGKLGHGRSFYELGEIYETDFVFKKNLGFVIDCYQRAVNNGYLEAAVKLSQIYFERGEDKKALQWLDRGIENEEVQFALGKYYFDGEYVTVNYTKALKYFSEAAKNGHSLAQYYMGLAYFYGYGVNQDEDRAIECLKISSDNDCLEAILLLSKIYEEKELGETNLFLEKAASLNCDSAMYKLGYNYAHGRFVEQDLNKAVEWYKKAANLNNSQAQCNLGLAYLNGAGLEKNVDFGVYWLERSVSNNSIVGAFNLGYCYEEGIGVEKNDYLALKFYLKAANLGNCDAQLAVGRMYKGHDNNQALYWYNKAMEKNPDEAYIGLIDVYMIEDKVDEEKVKMLLDCVVNKDSQKYLNAEIKFKKYIEERTEI